MYYILNHTNQIIAADDVLLHYLGLKTLEELTKKMICKELEIIPSVDNYVQIDTKDKSISFHSQTTLLKSLLGDLTLVHLLPMEKDATVTEKDLSTLLITNTPDTTIDEVSLDTSHDKKSEEAIRLIEEDTISIIEPTHEDVSFNHSDTIHVEPIVIHLEEISNQIGISAEDYKIFLDEYIDTAIALESDLRNGNETTVNNAINTLTQLADILHLPQVNTVISTLSAHSSQEKQKTIEIFYTILSRFTTQTKPQHIQENKTTESKDTPIQLEDVKPIPFNFQLSQAANDLSLPTELIEEFVHDFINQAHAETTKMLHAYEKGDLDTIQKIGHLLKGASSNLRINALSDTLHEIQFCEDFNKLEKLIRQYWGQFLSFEQQINMLTR